jgi:hypothetical protein
MWGANALFNMAGFTSFLADNSEQLGGYMKVTPAAQTAHGDTICESVDYDFVPTDAEKQRREVRPLHQSENLTPLDAVRANTKNQQESDKEQVVTADANTPRPLEVRMRGDLFGKCKVEKGHNKAIDLEFRGAEGLGKWPWSVADLYRKGAFVQCAIAEPALGGSFVKLNNSEEKIPIEFVNKKYFRALMDANY